ncbi:unnamed protein product [Tilletia controversa]|nr:unnamed protein product [Tilletia controversa]
MSNTPSGSVSRNTRTGGPTIEEFRALESASATIRERVDALGSQQRAEVGDLRDRIQAVATTLKDRFGRLESRLEAFFDQIKAKQESSTTSGVPTESPNPATSKSSDRGHRHLRRHPRKPRALPRSSPGNPVRRDGRGMGPCRASRHHARVAGAGGHLAFHTD